MGRTQLKIFIEVFIRNNDKGKKIFEI